MYNSRWIILYHHHHHVPEGLGVFPVPWSSRWIWFLHLFLGRPMFLRPFGLYCSACFGILFVSILCTCCSHFFWDYFISFTMFYVSVFSLIHSFLYLVFLFQVSVSKIPSALLLNVIPLFSSVPKLHFQTSMLLLAVMLWILNFVLLEGINPLNAVLNPIYHLLALLGAHHILHFSRIRVNSNA